MTAEELKDGIFAAIKLEQGTRVMIWERQDGPRPGKPYISLFPPRLVPLTEPDVSTAADAEDDDEFDAEQRTQHDLFLDISFWGVGAYVDACALARHGLRKAAVVAKLEEKGVVFIDAEPVLDLTALKGPNWEARAMFTARFRAAFADSEDIAIIETVNFQPSTGVPG